MEWPQHFLSHRSPRRFANNWCGISSAWWFPLNNIGFGDHRPNQRIYQYVRAVWYVRVVWKVICFNWLKRREWSSALITGKASHQPTQFNDSNLESPAESRAGDILLCKVRYKLKPRAALAWTGKDPRISPFAWDIVLSCHKVEHDLLLDLSHQWRASHISHADELEFPLFQDWTGREALTHFRCLAAWSTFRTTYFSETEVKATSRALLPTQNRPGAFRSQWDVSLLLPSFTLPHHSHCRPSCLLSPRFNGSKRLALPLRLAFLGARGKLQHCLLLAFNKSLGCRKSIQT